METTKDGMFRALLGVVVAFAAMFAASCAAKQCNAQEPKPPVAKAGVMHVDPVYVGLKYGNPDGSCVQLSIGMNGCNNNDIKMSTVVFNSQYGSAVRGGSGPSRVANYCQAREIKVWNVTGKNTIEWAKFAATTGRFAAIGFFSSHFQTLYGYEPDAPDGKKWIILNNWYNKTVNRYTDDEFRANHFRSGQWIVVPKRSTSKPPKIVQWWVS